MGQQARRRLPFPQFGQGKLEQGQFTRFGLNIVENTLHQPFFKAATGIDSGLFNRRAAFCRGHRQHIDQPRIHAAAKGFIFEHAAIEVGTQGKKYGQPRGVGGGQQGLQKGAAQRVIATEGKGFFKLVEDQ